MKTHQNTFKRRVVYHSFLAYREVLVEQLKLEVEALIKSKGLVFYQIKSDKTLNNKKVYEVILDTKTNDINLKMISNLTPFISQVFDKYEDSFLDGYYLQVISPSLTRELFTLEHYQLSIGKKLFLKYLVGKKVEKLRGELEAMDQTILIIKKEDSQKVRIEFKNIIKGKWIY